MHGRFSTPKRVKALRCVAVNFTVSAVERDGVWCCMGPVARWAFHYDLEDNYVFKEFRLHVPTLISSMRVQTALI